MMELHPYVAGFFVETENRLNVTEKFTGKVMANVGMACSDMLETAISAAVKCEKHLVRMSSSRKYEILRFIYEKLLEEKEHFARIISMEAGKPLKFALIEAERAAQTFLTAAEEAKRIHSEHLLLDWFPHGEGKEAIIKLFPVGTVAGITPFNFPLNLVAHKVAPAIAAACPMILKPASSTPLSALELARIIDMSPLPKGALSVLPMSHGVSAPLIEDERIKKISFTGSPQVGWKMKSECGRKRITLELGGNAAAVVAQSANLNEAVSKCVTGAFAYSGQVCIHTQRIFVHQSLYDNFLNEFLQKTALWKAGNPLEMETAVSVMIDEHNAIRVEQWIHEAMSQGAKCVAGGKRQGSFVEPTVLVNTNPQMSVWKDEVFGPVVIIHPYDDFQDAINMVNDSDFGLQAGVFTNSIDEMNRAFAQIDVGGVLINESPTFRVDHMPYGGIKQSGFGREGLKYAINEMSEMKVLLKPS
jgi:acyl-CoA reductase-like NAD-dependent aldehyde dehydrogenase